MAGRRSTVALAIAGAMLFAAQTAQGATVSIASDQFTNTTSSHKTIVEPDTFAYGNTIVAAGQSGRFYDGGASGIQWATSTDGGSTWSQGTLPGYTTHNGNGGPYDRVTDPAVAYDAKHNVWLISTLPLMPGASSPAVMTSRSTNGGTSWGAPVMTAAYQATTSYDKNWIVCDNHSGSPFYGNCYTTWDDNGHGNRLLASTSTDGGLTWSAPVATPSGSTGLGGQPLVQNNGTVIVPSANANETQIVSIRSTNGGASWSNTVLVANVAHHTVAGGLRTGPLPSAEIDGSDKVYVVWQDCRFRRGCKSNDIVMSTSTNGTTWSAVTRVPIDNTSSSVDHFIPGLGVDVSTAGASARLGLTYFAYANTRCGNSCGLQVGYIQSNNGGTNWGSPLPVAGPFSVTLAPDTTQGRMVGDYISTSWLNGKAFGPTAVGRAPSAGFAFGLDLEVTPGGIVGSGGAFSSASDKPVANAASDHAASQSAITKR
jgi:hypothetical protein